MNILLGKFVVISMYKFLWIYVVLLLLIFGIGSQILWIIIDIDLENMLVVDYLVCIFYNQIKVNFVMYDVIVVGVVNEIDVNGVYNMIFLFDIFDLIQLILVIDGVVDVDFMLIFMVDNIFQVGFGIICFEWMMLEVLVLDVVVQ